MLSFHSWRNRTGTPCPDYGHTTKEVFLKNVVSGLNAGIDLVFYPVECDPPIRVSFPFTRTIGIGG